jgi:MFS-type transporter involved in bile tolerance (Atg22 family)
MGTQTLPTSILVRYFLRRLAISRRRHNRDPAAAYNEAKVEVILISIALPVVAILSAVLIGSLRWLSREQAVRIQLPPKVIIGIAIWATCAVVGNWWLNKRFSRYRLDPTPCLAFDSERDQILATVQKVSMLLICGVAIPVIAFLFAFWSRI